MDKPIFNETTGKWEFVRFMRTESYNTRQEADNAYMEYIDWMFSDTDYDTYEENDL